VVSGTASPPGGEWKLEIKEGAARITVARVTGAGPLTITYDHAVVGQEYRLRVENKMTGVTVTAIATFTS
jgi:hypothetical protein